MIGCSCRRRNLKIGGGGVMCDKGHVPALFFVEGSELLFKLYDISIGDEGKGPLWWRGYLSIQTLGCWLSQMVRAERIYLYSFWISKKLLARLVSDILEVCALRRKA